MTEKTINAAQADVNAMRSLKLLEDRLRGESVPTHVPCGFCARPVKLTAYACDCGWKVA